MVQEQFEDPNFKAAVRRVWSKEAAPSTLHTSMRRLLDDSAQVRPTPRWAGYAIAAALLIAASLATWVPLENVSSDAGEEFPQTIAASMVRTHDACCKARDHHLLRGIHGDDFAAIGRRLSGDLKIPVLSTNLPNWTFVGAGPCPVWGHESAHLLYRDGTRTLSVFSIPAQDFGLAEKDERYAGSLNTHLLAGFLKDGGLYCVVADAPDGSLTTDQIARLRNQLQDAFTAESYSANPVSPPTLAAARN